VKHELRNAACLYASWGWHVHPLVPRAKRPLTEDGLNDATNDLAKVLSWWQRWPQANIGINCRKSGLLVIDVDPRNGGDDSMYELEEEWDELPMGPSATTGGGGMHFFFKHPDCDVVGKLAPGVDLKSRGYILAAPSIHPSGQPYEWDSHPDDWEELPELDGYWRERIESLVRVNGPRSLNVDTDDELRQVNAVDYIWRLAGREVNRAGFVRCPFHSDGKERTPSLKVTGPLWACHACNPLPGKAVMGGNIYDFAGLLWDFAVPLRGADFAEVSARLRRTLNASE
jgi:hypothetical protein